MTRDIPHYLHAFTRLHISMLLGLTQKAHLQRQAERRLAQISALTDEQTGY